MHSDSWVVRVDWTAAAPLDEAEGIALLGLLSDNKGAGPLWFRWQVEY